MLSDLSDIKGETEEVDQFNTVITDLSGFTNKVDDVFDKFIKSDEHWFYKTLIKLIK